MKAFDFVNQINHGKKNLIRDSDNPQLAEKDYVPFLVNKTLSYFPDTIVDANLINMHQDLPKSMQFDYFINKVRPRKRFAKWSKPEVDEKINALSEYFKINKNRAKELLTVLSADDIDEIIIKIKGE